MTTKDKDEQKELQTYLSEWQKRHEEYLEKKSQETSEQEEGVRDEEDRQEPMPSDLTAKSDDEDESKTENEELDELEELDTDQAEKSEVAEEGDESTLEQEEASKPEKKQIEKIHLHRALPILIVSSLLALSSLYFITPLSTIKNIVVSGNERVSQEEVIKNTQIDNRDYTLTTFLNRSKHAKKLTQANPWIEKAEILYQFPTTFTIKIKEYKVIAYEASSGNIYPVISNGSLINKPVKKENLPENYLRFNLSDKEKVKKLVQELEGVSETIINNIQTVDLTPSKATKDLLTLTMRDGHKILVPLSDIHKKLPHYSRIQSLLTEPSIVDMEAGIFSYPASLAQKESEEEKNSEENAQTETAETSEETTSEVNY